MRLKSIAIMAALAAVLLTGCTATPAENADDAAPASATPSPTPSASTVVASAPTSPVVGGCEALAAADGVAQIVGEVQRVTELDDMWHIGIETAGGLACSLMTSGLSAHVYVIPDSLVTGTVAELSAAPSCVEGSVSVECRAVSTSPGNVTMVVSSFPKTEDSATALSTLTGLAGAMGAATSPGAAARSQKATWTAPLDCDAIGKTIGMTSLLATDKLSTTLIPETASVVDSRLSQADSTSARCDWERIPTQKGDKGAHYSVIAVPDGAWAWQELSENVPDSEAATVAGFPARVTSTGEVYVSDGVNVLHLEGFGLAGVSVVDTAPGVLSVLARHGESTNG